MSRRQSTITAFHEAGHAVLAMANGFRVTEIANCLDDTGHGHVLYSQPKNPSLVDRLRIVVVAAGGAAADFRNWDAEKKLRGDETESDECVDGLRSDIESASMHLSEIRDPGSFEDYIGVAMVFLRKPEIWHWVELFGEVMQITPKLNGQEVLQRAFNQVPKITEKDLMFWREQIVFNRVLDR
ncbi:hypothetical protein [Diaphorobacter caeni]|uniref:hypothetical protein n=1 Tax=Diaphorobacter caeni TaxID=2784387 RepID=UPI0018904F32|nr:hypothetical protein [Diaphorobacter caeni]MBF5006350.1 hypothetical protein [Diaphorobacter caeni]